MASAGTIFDKNTSLSNPARNTNTATESICPNGWTLPTGKQIDSNKDMSNFNPILGGYYHNGTLDSESTRGVWWGSETDVGPLRDDLRYTGSILDRNYGRRNFGLYIRCVSEEKTATDLTYMQDMTFDS